MRFNIRSLLIVTIYVAVGCAALVQATETWASVMVTLTVATFLAAAVVSVTSSRGSRAFGCGFSLAGLGYLAVVYLPGAGDYVGPNLATTKLVAWAAQEFHNEEMDVASFAFSPQGTLLVTGQRRLPTRLWDPATGRVLRSGVPIHSAAFYHIGQSLCALAIGCLGGLLGQFCYTRSRRRAAFSSPITGPVE